MPVAAIADTSSIRRLIETAIGDLLHTGEDVDLRRASRRVFEDKCLEEVLWESFVDEWIDVAYEAAGERTHALDYNDLTDWCVCGDSAADHLGHDCQRSDCDCVRFVRSRQTKRPRLRKATKWSLERKAAPRVLMGELEARELRQKFGDLTGGV
jgi:hypothetical protein